MIPGLSPELSNLLEQKRNVTRLLHILASRGWTDDEIGLIVERIQHPKAREGMQRELKDRADEKAERAAEAAAEAEELRQALADEHDD